MLTASPVATVSSEKKRLSFVEVERVGVAQEIRLENVEVTVLVEVRGGSSHAGLFLSVDVVGGSRDDAYFLESTILLVME